MFVSSGGSDLGALGCCPLSCPLIIVMCPLNCPVLVCTPFLAPPVGERGADVIMSLSNIDTLLCAPLQLVFCLMGVAVSVQVSV